MTVCVACGRRTDPNRSFCPNCGSAVFVDSADRSRAVSMVPAHDIETASSDQPTQQSQQRSSQRARQQTRAQAMEQLRRQAPAVGAGSALWGLIKFGIFIYIVYRAYLFVAGIPDIRNVVEQVQRDGDLKPALDAIRARFETLVLDSSEPSTSTQPSETPAAAAPATPEAAAAVETAPPAGTRALGTGTEARVLSKVSPEYTPAAIRARVEGTVLLRATVQPDGTVSNVAVVRSLDKEFGLDEQAMMALRQWTFEPLERDGEPVRSAVQVQMTFKLQ